jgi:hypothetical protein
MTIEPIMAASNRILITSKGSAYPNFPVLTNAFPMSSILVRPLTMDVSGNLYLMMVRIQSVDRENDQYDDTTGIECKLDGSQEIEPQHKIESGCGNEHEQQESGSP